MPTKILLKNSVVKDKTPAPADISIGEVCVGAHQDSPMLIFKDALDNIITIKPGGDVESVNGQTGVVTLTAADVGAITAADVGDGTITIEKADGTVVGDFTVNQAGNTTITLPAADTDLQAVLDVGNTSTTGLDIADSGEVISLKPTGVIEASSLIRVNTTAAAPREGVLINGDLAVNTASYALRLHGDSSLDSDNYSIIGREISGITEIRSSNGWGGNYYFGAKPDFISISNDNASGRPTPIAGGNAVVHVYNGLNTQFGTDAAPLGNVMPKNDWSSIPELV